VLQVVHVNDVFHGAKHPYTQRLLSSVLKLEGSAAAAPLRRRGWRSSVR